MTSSLGAPATAADVKALGEQLQSWFASAVEKLEEKLHENNRLQNQKIETLRVELITQRIDQIVDAKLDERCPALKFLPGASSHLLPGAAASAATSCPALPQARVASPPPESAASAAPVAARTEDAPHCSCSPGVQR